MLLGIGKYKDRDTYLVQCKEIAEQLSSMIQEVLETSRLDFTQDVQISEPFDLSDTLPTLCEPYKLIAKANQIDFSVEIHEGCPLICQKKFREDSGQFAFQCGFLHQAWKQGFGRPLCRPYND